MDIAKPIIRTRRHTLKHLNSKTRHQFQQSTTKTKVMELGIRSQSKMKINHGYGIRNQSKMKLTEIKDNPDETYAFFMAKF